MHFQIVLLLLLHSDKRNGFLVFYTYNQERLATYINHLYFIFAFYRILKVTVMQLWVRRLQMLCLRIKIEDLNRPQPRKNRETNSLNHNNSLQAQKKWKNSKIRIWQRMAFKREKWSLIWKAWCDWTETKNDNRLWWNETQNKKTKILQLHEGHLWCDTWTANEKKRYQNRDDPQALIHTQLLLVLLFI